MRPSLPGDGESHDDSDVDSTDSDDDGDFTGDGDGDTPDASIPTQTEDVDGGDTDTSEAPGTQPSDPSAECLATGGAWVGDCERPFELDCGPERDAIVLCGLCGDVVRLEQQCIAGDVCDLSDSGEPFCRRCIGDECGEEEAECSGDDEGCLSWNQPWHCVGERVRPRGACVDSLCIDGGCAQAQLGAVGTFCGYGVDCQGDLCICGVDFGGTGTEAGCVNVPNGYCGRRDCTSDVCDAETEVCADWGISGRYGGAPSCIRQDGCRTAGASCGTLGPSQRCIEVPVKGGGGAAVRWALACWPDNLARVGEPCFQDAAGAPSDCIGGQCRAFQTQGGAREMTYCTTPCGEVGGCPSGTECVEWDGEHLCLALASDSRCSCPLGEDGVSCSDFDLQNRDRPVFGRSTNARVCYYFTAELVSQ